MAAVCELTDNKSVIDIGGLPCEVQFSILFLLGLDQAHVSRGVYVVVRDEVQNVGHWFQLMFDYGLVPEIL